MANDDDGFTLYGHVRSGNVYKPALMMALAETPFRFREVDLANGEQRGEAYLAINPFGKVPTLQHGSRYIRQSNTMLVYLASITGRFGSRDQGHRLRISEWLFWEQDQMFPGVGRTRFFTKVVKGDPALVEHFKAVGEAALDRVESQLSESDYLTGDTPTIADICIYAYARLAEEADFDMQGRPRTVAWRQAMEALPGYREPAALLG